MKHTNVTHYARATGEPRKLFEVLFLVALSVSLTLTAAASVRVPVEGKSLSVRLAAKRAKGFVTPPFAKSRAACADARAERGMFEVFMFSVLLRGD